MQFNRDEAGVMHLYRSPAVDTGMGLERILPSCRASMPTTRSTCCKRLVKAAARETSAADMDARR
jgi:alanyl-tRNA synthetase